MHYSPMRSFDHHASTMGFMTDMWVLALITPQPVINQSVTSWAGIASLSKVDRPERGDNTM